MDSMPLEIIDNNQLEILEQLSGDPDSYWIVYDFNLTMGWADSSYLWLPSPRMSSSGSRFGEYGINRYHSSSGIRHHGEGQPLCISKRNMTIINDRLTF
jgi:hypothetical protein